MVTGSCKSSRGLRVATGALAGLAIGIGPFATAAAPQDPDTLEEVVVSAQRRVERLQDVPVSVHVISGQDLAEQNQLSLETLAMSVPGLLLATSRPSHERYI